MYQVAERRVLAAPAPELDSIDRNDGTGVAPLETMVTWPHFLAEGAEPLALYTSFWVTDDAPPYQHAVVLSCFGVQPPVWLDTLCLHLDEHHE